MADRYIPEHRRNFKAKGTFKPDELRRRREEQQVEIRKQKREENLAKRRNMAITSPAPGAGAESDEEGGNDTQVCFHFHFSRSFLLFFFCLEAVPQFVPTFLVATRFVQRHTESPRPFVVLIRKGYSHSVSLKIFPSFCIGAASLLHWCC